jgi:hypothetical protein
MKLDLVTVRVGEEPHAADLQVYRELLTSVSPNFQGAFDGKFREADERRVALTDIMEQTFRIFLQWAHAQLGCGGDGNVPDISAMLADPAAARAKFEAKALADIAKDAENEASG